ncbi:MAG: peptidoglycan-binding protein [Gemmiger sp.]
MATVAQPPYWGTVLREGSRGPDVSLVQRWLNGLRGRWPAIRRLAVDGRYGANTASAVRTFQLLTGLSEDGEVGEDTWNELYTQYTDVNGLGEIYPGIPMRTGQQGATVQSAQTLLKDTVPSLSADGYFGRATRQAVIAFQLTRRLTPDGIIGPRTWDSLYGS